MKKQIAYLQRLFYDLWNDFGSAYVLVRYSERTVIGRRGFTDEEKKNGLVLVFNSKTNNRLEWDGDGNMTCVLAFGATREDVSIHHDDLIGLFSPEAGVQFLRTGTAGERSSLEPETRPAPDRDGDNQIVSLTDFKKRKSGDAS